MIIQTLEKALGKNWRSSSSGIITVVSIITAFVISTQPYMVDFLPENIKKYVTGIATLMAAVSGIYFSLAVKDGKVTGGTIPQTQEASRRIKGSKK